MSGLLVNILRRTRFNGSSSYKLLEWSIPTFNLNKSVSSTSAIIEKHEAIAKKLSEDSKKKSKHSIKITLLGKNDTITVTSLEDAQKLSKRRDMNLVKVEEYDVKTQRPVYKLVSTAELLAEEGSEKKNTSSKKQEKSLNIGSRIADHDLQSRLKNISKWLQKGNEVRILIHGTNADDSGIQKVFNAIDSLVKGVGGRLVQKVNKGGNMKFSILPPSQGSKSGSDDKNS